MNTEYDGVILGAGHNGLILQAYLAKAGYSTVSLDRGRLAGGGLTTVKEPPGSGNLHNTHSYFHRGITSMPWYAELELERHGVRYRQPDLSTAIVLKNGEVLEWWSDFERTVESFARFDRSDADTLRRWRDAFIPVVEKILVPESQSPPLSPGDRETHLRTSSTGRLLLETSKLSPVEFVLREFKHPAIQAGLLFFNGLREVDLRCPGFGHHIPALFASGTHPQMVLGGSVNLANALISAVEENGGEVVTGVTPSKITVSGSRAATVQTNEGEEFKARRFVASSLNPQQTFIELLGEPSIGSEWLKKARNYKYNLLAPLFSVNLNLAEEPHYTASERYPHLQDALMVVLGLERFEQFPEIVRHHEAGTLPSTVMWGSCPTRFDPSQAPGGGHTAFMWEKLPYRLHGDPRNWDAYKDRHGREMIDLWAQYAPNLNESLVNFFTGSPLDTERTLPNMVGGDLLVGSFENGQIGHNRPFPGAGHYRGPIDGLYLCGSSSHPGGNITGLPGHNAARVLLADLAT